MDTMEMKDMDNLAQKLLRAWRDRDLLAFREVLDAGCDVNYIFTNENNQPLLGQISRDANNAESKDFLSAILKVPGINLNQQYVSGKCAIHHAAEISNFPVLTALVCHNADVNALDQNGSTALHILLDNWKKDGASLECFILLLNAKSIKINIINLKGYSAIHLATSRNIEEAVLALLEMGSLLDIDTTSVEGVTTRTAIIEKFPALETKLPEENTCVDMDASRLFLILEQSEERFCTAFDKEMQQASDLLTFSNGTYTFLQYACVNNKNSAVKCLLRNNADPYYTPQHNSISSIDEAAKNGNAEIMKLLLEFSKEKPPMKHDTPLHTVSKYCHNSRGHSEVLELLLNKRWGSDKIDVNAQDIQGKTALHYAAVYSDDDAILAILNHGGYIASLNKDGETPLNDIPTHVLRSFLDSKITYRDIKANSQNQITFDCSFLHHPGMGESPKEQSRSSTPSEESGLKANPIFYEETKPLLLMARSEGHRHLLTHPVLTSFTYFKWQRIQVFFYLNLLFYLTLCILLSTYILVYQTTLIEQIKNSTAQINNSPPNDNHMLAYTFLGAIILIFIVIFFAREILQFAINPEEYLKKFENYVELLLVFLSAYLIINDFSQHFREDFHTVYIRPQVSAIVILLGWIQLMFLIGKHPNVSIHVEMFRTVSYSFLRFLKWYVLIIIAFALSFYVLFRGRPSDCKDPNPFTSPHHSLFKTFVMMTGEFETDGIPMDIFVGTSHIILILFIFLIAIILVNLLNGLAVADTKEIRDDAYLYSCVSRVELISLIEGIFLGDSANFMKPVYSIFSRDPDYFAKKIAFFPSLLPDGEITVLYKRDKNKIHFKSDIIGHTRESKYFLDMPTMNAAKKISERTKSEKALTTDQFIVEKIELLLSKTMQDIEKMLNATRTTQ